MTVKLVSNVCEHGDHPAPPGRRFCSRACEKCENAEQPTDKDFCAEICLKKGERIAARKRK